MTKNTVQTPKNLAYHGSKIQGLAEIIPQGKSPIFAAKDKIMAALYSVRRQDSPGTFGRTIGQDENNMPFIVERYKHAFDDIYDNRAVSIYALDESSFEYNKSCWRRMSRHPQRVIQEIKIDNIKDFLLEAEKQGRLIIYRYPNRPKSVPKDDSDLIEMCLKLGNQHNLQEFKTLFPSLYQKNKDKLDSIKCDKRLTNTQVVV